MKMLIRLLSRSSQIYTKQVKPATSIIQQYNKHMSTIIVNTNDMDSFQDVLPKAIGVLSQSDMFKAVPEIKEFLKKLINLNVNGGKKIRGISTVIAYEMFEKPENITEESLELARVLGWCAEMMQAYFLILDDIMDNSTTRRGLPCWYRNPEVGLRAINDALLIKCSFYEIVKLYFKDKPFYKEIVALFNDSLFYTSIGQHLDWETATKKKDFSQFTHEQYNAISRYKSGYYTYNLPIALGLLLTNNTDKQALKQIEDICLDIGSFFQVQDDFIDVFGDTSTTGKIGSDIEEGKCSWVALTALQRCNPAQRNTFTACYGTKDPANHERIKQLYNELGLQQLYREHESELHKKIKQKIDKLPKNLSPQLFHKLIDNIHQRKW